MPFIRVRKHYLHIPYLILGLLEFGLYCFAVWLTDYPLQLMGADMSEYPAANSAQVIIFALILSFSTLAMGCYVSLVREGTASILFRILVSFCLLGSITMTLMRAVLPDLALDDDRSFWAIVIAIGLAFIVRVLFVWLVDATQLKRRVVIFGAGKNAQKILDAYRDQQRLMAVQIIGCISNNFDHAEIEEKHRIPAPEDWVAYCLKYKITEIVMAADERRGSQGSRLPVEDFLWCKLKGVAITDALDFYERELNKIELDMLRPSWLLLSDGFNCSKSRDWSKRLFDIAISGALCLVLWPFALLTAVAVMIETGRPVLYYQTRTGRDGKPFRIYKFRSMYQNAEQAGKAVWAQKNDSRITRVGAVIRNTRLDEIPQLFNVLQGDMSFVGPRPERPEFVEDLIEKIPFYDTRHQVKPGLMGWAQLKYPYGASVDDAKNKLEYDLYYTKNHSLLMDVLIMIQTVEIILLGKGVH